VLDHIVFPIGGLEKKEVRRIASEKGLPVAARKDSQEVCFVPDRRRLQFIRDLRDSDPERWRRLPSDTSGPFVSLDGKIIGEHSGYEKYTVGQRKGLGMGFGERIFVQKVVPETRSVVLGPYEELGVDRIKAVDSNWHIDAPIERDFRCEIKVRYRNESCFATVRIARDGSFEAVLDSPRYGVAPGQSLVCYWRDRLLGGGRIVR
ncbi:MAG: tRNA 2-thiouridine(34) synthase MnmA, partial [Thermoguttaceae bacterium]|nr:tRNA 2-thiouridine(34) synthase MnmA [Thermoguttaceae bacterium]